MSRRTWPPLTPAPGRGGPPRCLAQHKWGIIPRTEQDGATRHAPPLWESPPSPYISSIPTRKAQKVASVVMFVLFLCLRTEMRRLTYVRRKILATRRIRRIWIRYNEIKRRTVRKMWTVNGGGGSRRFTRSWGLGFGMHVCLRLRIYSILSTISGYC
jgi:hypothetical protein